VSGADALWTPALDNLTFKASSLLRFVIHSLFPGRVALVSSFGADSAVLLHIVAQINNVTPVGFVDTGRHFPETLAYRDELCARLRLTNVINAAPAESTLETDDPEQTLFASNPDHCCEIRKVRPLADALANYKGWITGRKRYQSATRAALRLVESDGDRTKINPLVGWTAGNILDYIRNSNLPSHPLVARGFPSIGCLPCTSSVGPGEDARSGRWCGLTKTECGIHLGPLGGAAL